MPIITNPNAILNGYTFDFPTLKCVQKYFNIQLKPRQVYRLGSGKFAPYHKSSTIFNNIPDLVGFDFPVLLYSKGESKGTVCILGQDALRDPKDPKLRNININNDIPIGFPYAISFESTYKNVMIYHNLVKCLLDSGYNVYLTDVWKSWDVMHLSRLGIWNNNNPHKQCLICEFNTLPIDYVILMGRTAKNKFNSIKQFISKVPVEIEIPHLSPSNNGTWAKIKLKYGKNKKDYIKEKLEESGIEINCPNCPVANTLEE